MAKLGSGQAGVKPRNGNRMAFVRAHAFLHRWTESISRVVHSLRSLPLAVSGLAVE